MWVQLLSLALGQNFMQSSSQLDVAVRPVVMYRYEDAACTSMIYSGWMQQSWTRVPGAHYCFDITSGLLCNTRCFVKMSCAFESGSGIIFKRMADSSCSAAVTDPAPVAPDLTWVGVEGFFNGTCTRFGDSYVRFEQAIEMASSEPGPHAYMGYPDCSAEGDVEIVPGSDNDPGHAYVTEYHLQFYSDDNCQEVFEVDVSSTRTTSRFEFRIFRGAQHCYDMVDMTPRPNTSSRVADYSMRNFRFFCSNQDGVGNGIMLQQDFRGQRCGGSNRELSTWRDAFYPMNFPHVQDLFNGRCIRWGQYSAQFDRAWDTEHYPQCANYACDEGLCAGGRVRDPNDVGGQPFTGSIRQSPSGNSARTPAMGLPLAVAVAASLLALADPERWTRALRV